MQYVQTSNIWIFASNIKYEHNFIQLVEKRNGDHMCILYLVLKLLDIFKIIVLLKHFKTPVIN